MYPGRPILALLAIVTAALTWWLLQQTAVDETPPLRTGGERPIDYYLTGVDVTRMDASGNPAHRLRANDLRHYSDDDTSELSRPHLTVYQSEKPPWEIRSERAWVSADGDLLLLAGEVLIEREGDALNRPVQMHTRDLRVQPHQDYAETDETVRVRSEDDWIDAVGLQAWLRPPSRLKFLSQAKGYYVPR